MTHPIHPCYGQRLPVVRSRNRYVGKDALAVRLPSGHVLALPLDWTDRRPQNPPMMVGDRPVRLDPRALLALVAHVADLQTRVRASATVPATVAVPDRTDPVSPDVHDPPAASAPPCPTAGSATARRARTRIVTKRARR